MTNKMIAVLALLLTVGVLGCGPGPGSSPEETARNWAEVNIADIPLEYERDLHRKEWKLDCMEEELEWGADKGKIRKDIDVGRAELEFKRDNMDKILDNIEFDVVNVQKKDDNNVHVTIKTWRYDVKSGKGPKDFYLQYEAREETLPLVNVDGDWKIKNKD